MYVQVPAICPNGHLSPNAIELGLGFGRVKIAPIGMVCQVCGLIAYTPEGVYAATDDVVSMPPAALELALRFLREAATANGQAREEAIAKVSDAAPAIGRLLASAKAAAPKDWATYVGWLIAILLAYVARCDSQAALAVAREQAAAQQRQVDIAGHELDLHRQDSEFQRRVALEALEVSRQGVAAQVEVNTIQLRAVEAESRPPKLKAQPRSPAAKDRKNKRKQSDHSKRKNR